MLGSSKLESENKDMIENQLNLSIEYNQSDNEMIKRQASDAVLSSGDFLNWDHAYESLFNSLEEELKVHD